MATVITGLGDSGPGRPVPVVPALVEFGSALHVLRDPGHHGATEWAARVSAAMSPRLLARTQSWWWTAQAIRATPFVTAASPDGGSPPDGGFPAALARLRALPPARLARQLLRPVSPPGDLSAALHWSRSRGPAVTAVVETLAARPAGAAADFLDFLETSWHEWFSAEWEAIRPHLAGRARAFADTVSTHGAVTALTSTDSSVTATSSGNSVSIAKIRNARHDVTRRGLLVAPSAYIRPHLYVADVPRLASVAVSRSGLGTPRWHWFALNTDDYWAARTHLGAGPFNVRIKDELGHTVVIPRLRLAPGRTIHTRTWMYEVPGAAPGTATHAASAAPSPAANRSPTPASTGCASSQ